MPAVPRRRALAALVAAAVVGGAGGLAVSLVTPATYTASGTVFVSTSGSSTSLSAQPTFAKQYRDSWAGVVTTPIVLQSVISELHLATSVTALAKQIQVTRPADTVLVEIAVNDPSARRAALIANAVQDRLVDVAPLLTPTKASAEQPNPLAIVRRAKAAPSGPSALVLALGGALAGVLVWAVAAAVLLILRTPRPPAGRPAPSML